MKLYVHEKHAVITDPASAPRHFILQAIHPERRVVVLESRFSVDAVSDLGHLLGSASDDDLFELYYPTESELEALVRRFDVAFENHGWLIRLHDEALRGACPYLLHPGNELQMLLDGTKQFATQEHFYPPYKHEDEDKFDRHVSAGRLHKEVVLDTKYFQKQRKDGIEGFRLIYYTRKGEEWRVPAWKMLWSAAERQPWNDGYERLMSMLFGYENWQTDWWVNFIGDKGGSWRGTIIYVPVGETQLSAIEDVGFRAFPPLADSPLAFRLCDDQPTEEGASQMMGQAATALIRAFVKARYVAMFVKDQPGPCYTVPSDQIPELNRHISRELEVIARRSSGQNLPPEHPSSSFVRP